MVLVDTSVWISHFRTGNAKLKNLLVKGEVSCHPFIIGELACGHIKQRDKILNLLHELPVVEMLDHDEVLYFIDQKQLMGKGLGLIDIHLLASAVLSDIHLWTLDNKLKQAAVKLKVDYLS